MDASTKRAVEELFGQYEEGLVTKQEISTQIDDRLEKNSISLDEALELHVRLYALSE